MEIRFVICAQGIALDQRHNTLSIFHVIEELNSPAFPFVLPSMTMIALFDRLADEPNEPDDVRVVISLGAEEVVNQPLGITFQGRLRTRAITDVAGLIIAAPGVLNVTYRYGNDRTATWSIAVNNIARPVVQSVLPL